MSKYILRLDDACEKRDQAKWDRLEKILDLYKIKPLVGIIPHCEDAMMDKYEFDNDFWTCVDRWMDKGWIIALHGYNHVYSTNEGGVNPINNRSEFAGESLEVQMNKIKSAVDIFHTHGIDPMVFFAPSHTFDDNTIVALKEKSNIRFISDTVANKSYVKDGITFVPQQSGKVRSLPFSIVTFCYHPNAMADTDYFELEKFIKKNNKKFIAFPLEETTRKMNVFDNLLKKMYFARR